MIEKLKYLDLLDKLNLPKSEYVITGGSWLTLMDIRENDDIDIIVSAKLKEKYDSYLERLDSTTRLEAKSKIDKSKKHANKITTIAKAKNVTNLVKNYRVEIDGYPFVYFNLFYKYKKPRKRRQDKYDRKKIKRFFDKKKHFLPQYRNLFDSCKIAPISDFSFEYRDDILFRTWVLKTENKKAWKNFCNLPANRKVDYKKLFRFYKSLRDKGQKKSIPVVKIKNKLYFAGGATRMGCMLALGFKYIKIEERFLPNNKWNDIITLETHHFKKMNGNIIDQFKRFVNNIKII